MSELVNVEDLHTALGLQRGELISIVGGGGKTTTMFALGRALAGTSVMTTTTKMGADQNRSHEVLLDPTDDALASALLAQQRIVAWRAVDGTKALGVSAATADRWYDIADNVIVEADGSRRRPFKAPRPFEPVVPTRTTTLIACIGAGALGRVIVDACHRPLRVAAVAECQPGERLTPERAARVLLSDRGSRKGLPEGARFAVVICQVTERQAQLAAELAERLALSTVVQTQPFN